MKSGIELIEIERAEQISKHGRTVRKDKNYNTDGQLWKGARMIIDQDHNEWPEDWDKDVWLHIANKTRTEQLVIAGALIAAEIDRLNPDL